MWIDLVEGILEEFAEQHDRYLAKYALSDLGIYISKKKAEKVAKRQLDARRENERNRLNYVKNREKMKEARRRRYAKAKGGQVRPYRRKNAQ